jgi:hypothetical protein
MGSFETFVTIYNLTRPDIPKPFGWIFLNAAMRNSDPNMPLFSHSTKWPYYVKSCYNRQLCCINNALILNKYYGWLKEQSKTIRDSIFGFHLNQLFPRARLIFTFKKDAVRNVNDLLHKKRKESSVVSVF